jgi:hypothetical protein
MPEEAVLNVKATNPKASETKKLVNTVKLRPGMYKIAALPDYTQCSVTLNGTTVNQMQN